MGSANNTLTLQVLLRESRDAHKNVIEQINVKIADLRDRVKRIVQSIADENSKYQAKSRFPILIFDNAVDILQT